MSLFKKIDKTQDLDLEKIQESDEKSKRILTGNTRKFAFIMALGLTVFTLYTAIFGVMLPMIQRGIHVCIILALIFLWYPATKKSPKNIPSIIDWILVAIALWCLIWTITNHQRFLMRIPFASAINNMDLFVGIVLTILCLEAGRRTLGLSITVLAGIFIVYAFASPYLPGILNFKGLSINKFVEQVYLTTEGIFGSLTGMSATMLFAFIAFGTILQFVGADKLFMDICISIAGKKAGGPAKVACLSSAIMGTISGSSIANVVTTGTLTIPLMKSTGYKPEEAGAIETAASSGGQIMPPVMGTGAFILAETVGIQYSYVIKISVIPAIIYYMLIWFIIDAKAKKRNIKGLDNVPDFKNSMINGGIFFIPILFLIVLLALGFTPFITAVLCTVGIFIAAQLRKKTRISFKKLCMALEACAVGMLSITGVILCASIIIGMINITGLMTKMTQIILAISQGKLFLTIVLCAIIAYILGMGLPVPTCYVLLSTLAAPALVQLGVPMLNGHLTVFWFTQLAQITPPVCMAAFAAAAIAKAHPMKTGFEALKFSFGFYLVPLLFIYSNIIDGSLLNKIIIGVTTLVSMYFIAASTERYYLGYKGPVVGIVSGLIAVLLFISSFNQFNDMNRVGFIIVSAVLAVIMTIISKKKKVNI